MKLDHRLKACAKQTHVLLKLSTTNYTLASLICKLKLMACNKTIFAFSDFSKLLQTHCFHFVEVMVIKMKNQKYGSGQNIIELWQF